MNPQLVLSLFPGIGLLDMAFEEEGFTVVRGPDLLWGGRIQKFHAMPGRFDGVIGGPPCQSFSKFVHLVRANGYQPRHGNLIPEYERVVAEAGPGWFVMEEVPAAPAPAVAGYGVHSFLLNNRQFGAVQNRRRRISFGWRGARKVLHVPTVALESLEYEHAVTGGPRSRPVAKFAGGQPKRGHSDSKRAVSDMLRLQGLPEDFDIPPFRVDAKCEAIGNGVPLPMGRAIARAVKSALEAP